MGWIVNRRADKAGDAFPGHKILIFQGDVPAVQRGFNQLTLLLARLFVFKLHGEIRQAVAKQHHDLLLFEDALATLLTGNASSNALAIEFTLLSSTPWLKSRKRNEI